MTGIYTLGKAMRDAQRAYFKDRSRENLIASKQLESAFDKELEKALDALPLVPSDYPHKDGCSFTRSPIWLCDCPRPAHKRSAP
jgi:hypothetical protein